MSTNKYKVIFEEFSCKHFLIKKFSKKKLQKIFEKPKKSLEVLSEKIDLALERELVEAITDRNNSLVICKIEFKIYHNESPKNSGNRCIVIKDDIKKEVRILFCYHKNDAGGGSETVW